jgi:hypothetical protein
MKHTSLRLFILFVCTAGSLAILQNAFDVSDHKKAERAVRNFHANGRAEAFGEYLERTAPGGAWDTQITAGCRGVVRTRYATPGALYEFDFDVPARTFHPANERGRAALGAFLSAAPLKVPPKDPLEDPRRSPTLPRGGP